MHNNSLTILNFSLNLIKNIGYFHAYFKHPENKTFFPLGIIQSKYIYFTEHNLYTSFLFWGDYTFKNFSTLYPQKYSSLDLSLDYTDWAQLTVDLLADRILYFPELLTFLDDVLTQSHKYNVIDLELKLEKIIFLYSSKKESNFNIKNTDFFKTQNITQTESIIKTLNIEEYKNLKEIYKTDSKIVEVIKTTKPEKQNFWQKLKNKF